MIRLLSAAGVMIFAAGLYAGVHLQSLTCRAIHSEGVRLTWIDC